jgi:hypothetical protein
LGDTFGVFFQVQMIWYKLFLKIRRRLKMPMKKKIHLFWNAKGRLEVWKTFFFVFSSRKQNIMSKISCLHLVISYPKCPHVGLSWSWCRMYLASFGVTHNLITLSPHYLWSLPWMMVNGNAFMANYLLSSLVIVCRENISFKVSLNRTTLVFLDMVCPCKEVLILIYWYCSIIVQPW